MEQWTFNPDCLTAGSDLQGPDGAECARCGTFAPESDLCPDPTFEDSWLCPDCYGDTMAEVDEEAHQRELHARDRDEAMAEDAAWARVEDLRERRS